MAHQSAQEVAQKGADAVSRAGELRAALGSPDELRRLASVLLAAVPHGCDVVAWSPEGYNVALVAAVLGYADDRELTVHRASLLAPLATSLRRERWTWVSAEELLGFGRPRSWAVTWAAERGGEPHAASVAALSLVN